MEISIGYIKYYKSKFWFFRFYRFTKVLGIKVRILGMEFYVGERDRFYKLFTMGINKQNEEHELQGNIR